MIQLFARDRVCMPGDSLTAGSSTPTNNTRWVMPWRDILRGFYTRDGHGLAGIPGAYMSGVTNYDMGMPEIVMCAVGGDKTEDVTANFSARVGTYNPDVIIIGESANNVADSNPTYTTTVNALVAKLVDPAQYRNSKVPPAMLWWAPAWVGSETVGGTNQAAILGHNAIIKAACAAANPVIEFVDIQQAWLALPVIPPTGTYTCSDLVHLTLAGAQFVTGEIMKHITLRPDVRP